MANGYIFKHKQTLEENGVETTNTFTSPLYSDIEQTRAEGIKYWNNAQSVNWDVVDKVNSELSLFSKNNGIESKVWGGMKGECSITRA